MLTPKQIVEELDRYIVGQGEAKRAVAVALRNRYRRTRLDPAMQDEVTPKNILMVGPTGVGKTEIARRLAKLVDAPFIKVEATKYTEVGYVGRDVESMVRDLVEASIRLVKERRMKDVQLEAETRAQAQLIELLVPISKKSSQKNQNPLAALLGPPSNEPPPNEEEQTFIKDKRERVARQLANGELEQVELEIDVEVSAGAAIELMPGMGVDMNLQDIFGGLLPKQHKRRRVKVSEARRILIQQEADKLIDMDEVTREALQKAEQEGIIFLDEMDKIAGRSAGSGPDVSREGVQRDILPIVEGCTVVTKYGPVKTDYMLFIAAGAFHVAKVTDLIPELQGRFPIKVELKPLSEKDLKNILTQPENSIIKQTQALLKVDGVDVVFEEDALQAVAEFAFRANETTENIGARRLHTIVENMMEDISFNAADIHPETKVNINAQYVAEHMEKDLRERNLKKYII